MHIDYKQVGAHIKQARKMRAMTQEQLAEHLDVSIGYVSQVERGITKISLDLLAAVVTVLDCEIAFFIDGVTIAQKTICPMLCWNKSERSRRKRRSFYSG